MKLLGNKILLIGTSVLIVFCACCGILGLIGSNYNPKTTVTQNIHTISFVSSTTSSPKPKLTSLPNPTLMPKSTPTKKPILTPTLTVLPTLPEHLAFNGDILGVMEAGDSLHPITHDNPLPAYVEQNGTYFDPAPTWTQCSDFDVNSGVLQDFVAVIVGMVGTMRYAVTVEINEDNPAYINPGTPLYPGANNTGGSINVYESDLHGRRWQQVYGPSQQDPVIVLQAGRVSGTVDSWLATTDQSQHDAVATLHLQGDWRCG